MAVVIMIVNYYPKTFIVQATGFKPLNLRSSINCSTNFAAAAGKKCLITFNFCSIFMTIGLKNVLKASNFTH